MLRYLKPIGSTLSWMRGKMRKTGIPFRVDMSFRLLSDAVEWGSACFKTCLIVVGNHATNCWSRVRDFVRHAVRLGWKSQGFKMLVLSADARLRRLTAMLTAVAVALVIFSTFMISSLGGSRKNAGGVRTVQGATQVVAVESKGRGVTSPSQVRRPAEKARVEMEQKHSAAVINRPDKSTDLPVVAIVNDDQPIKTQSAQLPPVGTRPVPESTPFAPQSQSAYTAIKRSNYDQPMHSDRESVQRVSTAAFNLPREPEQTTTVKRVGTMVLPPLPAGEHPVMRVASVEPVAQKSSEEEKARKPAAATAATEPAKPANEAKGAGEAETIGVPPPREQPQFLRNDSVLMTPGDYQWEIGVSYARNLNQSPVGQIIGESSFVGNLRRVNRVLQMPLELRIGLTENLQGSVSLPVGWANQEISIATAGLTDESFGIGDLTLGLTRLIRQGDLTEPNILGFFSLSIPTGQSSLATSLDDPSIALGRGFYSMTTGLTVTKTIDPLVFFFGGGYQHNFEASFSQVGRLNPGNGAFYRLGVGYAVNSNVSLSTAFTGAFLDKAELNDIRLGGTAREPLSLRIAATVVNKKKSVRKARTVEPFVNLGLNEDATDTILGVTWTY